MMDEATGELVERRLEHQSGEAHAFYRSLPKPVRVGIEATGTLHWFERLLAELGHELWIGEPKKGTPSTVLQVLKQRVSRQMRRRRRRVSVAQMALPLADAGPPRFWQPRFYDFNV